MRAILLAAGLGTRLRPLTDTLPKCLVPIHDRPLLVYWLEALFDDRRIERVLINTHYLAEQVRAVVAGVPWRDRIDMVHEPHLLGTGGTVLANRAWCGRPPIFVAHADNLTDAPPSHSSTRTSPHDPDVAMTLLAFRTERRNTAASSSSMTAARHRFHEKVADPPGNLANGAVYVFEDEVVDRIAALAGRSSISRRKSFPALLPRIQAVEHKAASSWTSARRRRLNRLAGHSVRHLDKTGRCDYIRWLFRLAGTFAAL